MRMIITNQPEAEKKLDRLVKLFAFIGLCTGA
ncbi:hypothetical protein OTSGILL_2719 [Orientia tsutsugamushi str. Gilliam]|uniref:Uncharacterized protein n=1 Tax=Orientia tsutsugamushi str. Gilliam TaxID=1359184 RepID=A0A0F3M5S0_ORITS|nr:hypothetical protein OTSGILL_2719 [Orientia tsutsugamushi str. Gilliam]KJV56434.1 hypothetical protein OTSKATO_0307 [Orientia tsutsugamushi str. Kato PP]